MARDVPQMARDVTQKGARPLSDETTGSDQTKPKRRRRRSHPEKQPVALRPGPQGLDLRSAGAQALAAWRLDLIDHCGGQAVISVPERILVERAITTELLIQDADRHLLAMDTTIQANGYVALVKERQTLVDSQARLLDRLGFKAAPKPPKSLAQVTAEILAQDEGRARAQEPTQSTQAPEPSGTGAHQSHKSPATRHGAPSQAQERPSESVTVRPATVAPAEVSIAF
jgi:hypothetical protein